MDKLIEIALKLLSELGRLYDIVTQKLLIARLNVVALLIEVHLAKGDIESQVHEFLHFDHDS